MKISISFYHNRNRIVFIFYKINLKNFATCTTQLHNIFVFSLHQLIRLIILCIKVLRYNYQKMNSLRNILHFMFKCVNFVNSYLKKYLTKKNFIVVF